MKEEAFLISARHEERAFCSLCAVKEALLVATTSDLIVDACFIYFSVIRITGWTWLPLPVVNNTVIHDASLNLWLDYLEMSVQCLDFVSVGLLGLSICSEGIEGLVCGLFLFAIGVALQAVLVVWMFVSCFDVASATGTFDGHVLLLAMCVSFFPHLAVLLWRSFILVKAQAFRRTLRRESEVRLRRANEQTRLVKP